MEEARTLRSYNAFLRVAHDITMSNIARCVDDLAAEVALPEPRRNVALAREDCARLGNLLVRSRRLFRSWSDASQGLVLALQQPLNTVEDVLRDLRNTLREWPEEQEDLKSTFDLNFSLRSREVELRLAQVRFHLAAYERFTVQMVHDLQLVSRRADTSFAIRTEIIRRQALDLESESIRALETFGVMTRAGVQIGQEWGPDVGNREVSTTAEEELLAGRS